ncbi:DMT family transporter [Motiliproteus coralliicola]|uniref:DMT family transporter n=1 Tax=Motiliproteus coralliicola TaxID=2283196 RepID=A0A369WTE7_9GAMM|nr:DMT family transporter [Motiliproteus coralliicola]RDE24861.1 DMT family transporter [Motiliproteus coralliicola]
MPYFFAIAAITLWSSLALLATRLNHLPPFLVLGVALLLGGLMSLPKYRQWHPKRSILQMGVFGIFGYHFALFMAYRHAPAVEANLLNYLWPLLIVLFSPLYLPGFHLNRNHILGGLLGFSGAATVILGGNSASFNSDHSLGYALGIAAAVIWARYSLLTRRSGDFSSATVGLFCLLAGLLALLCHGLFETTPSMNQQDLITMALLGLGPMGISFYCWDAAMKRGDPRTIGALSYFTPLMSTGLLILFGDDPLSSNVIIALALISGGAVLGTLKARPKKLDPQKSPA